MPECDAAPCTAVRGRVGACTRRCRSVRHADLVSAAITQAEDEELISYLCWVCHNSATGTDSAGRTPLHVAASCGRSKLCEWLVQVRGVSLNTEDRESGMTALQRAVFYGQLGCVRTLMKLGASPLTQDHADMTAYDGAHADRRPAGDLHIHLPCEAYVWGTNRWYSIGVERIKERPTPEPLELFRRAGVWIKQIAMSKFHTVFLTQGGSVYTCGHGIGGRLGHGDEESVLTPNELRGLKGETCVQVAVSVDHTVLLMESGTVWTCGANHSYQLGVSPPPAQLTAPRPLDWSRSLKPRISGVCAARYHTVFWNADALYCVGLNGGQVGQHKDETKDKRILTPRKVTMLNGGSGSLQLTHVACSDGATAAATASGDVLLMHQYRCRRVASRMLNLRQLRVFGGVLEGTPEGSRGGQERSAPLRLLLLSAEGWLYLWQQDRPAVTRCEIGLRREMCVADMQLDRHGLIFVSETGQAFTGTFNSPETSTKEVEKTQKHANKDSRSRQGGSSGPSRVHVRVTRVPHVHRGVRVTCDGTGGNAAVIQCDPRSALTELPEVAPSTLQSDFGALLNSADETDAIHDCILQAGESRFACHRFVLASASATLAQQLATCAGDSPLRVEAPPAALRQLLLFIYTGSCDLLRPGTTDFSLDAECPQQAKSASGPKSRKQKQKSSQPVQVVRELARKLGLHTLYRRLEGVRISGGRVEHPSGWYTTPSPLCLERCSPTGEGLADACLSSQEGSMFNCHRCVLAARLEYFNMMYSSCFWSESVSGGPVRLAMPAPVLELVLQFCYTGEARLAADHRDNLDTDDLELLCGLLAAADHLMAARLKQMCEVALSGQLTLRNTVELLEFSCLYGADQLKTTCMEFICLNLAAVMENRSLEAASDEVVADLTRHYRSTNATLRRYRPPPRIAGPPTADLVRRVHAAYPVQWDEPLPELQTSDEPRSRPPPRRRVSRRASGDGETDARRPAGPELDNRSRTTSTSSLISQISRTSDEGELDFSDLTEREIASPPVEFTLVTRRRPDRAERQTSQSDHTEVTPERYIPGHTPKPRPVRAPQPIAAPHCAVDPDHVTAANQSASPPTAASPLEAFPSLGDTLPAMTSDGVRSKGPGVAVSPPAEREPPRDARRSGKKSRRGRVLDLSEAGLQSVTSHATSPPGQLMSPPGHVTSPKQNGHQPTALRPGQVVWGQRKSGANGVSSLAAIMAEEAAEARCPPVSPPPGSAPLPVSSHPSPGTPLTTPVSPPTRVWGAAGPLSPANHSAEAALPAVTSFDDIIQQERRKIKTRTEISNKSLVLIQIEERAIAELLKHYGAEHTTTERITVERLHMDAAEPQWSRRPR